MAADRYNEAATEEGATVLKITYVSISVSFLYFFFTELNVKESDVRVCDESSCKYGGVCKEEGDGLKCACQFQVRSAHFSICLLCQTLENPEATWLFFFPYFLPGEMVSLAPSL